MSRLIVAPIVEGDGEVPAVPVLLRNIWYNLLGGEFIEVLKPIRERRNRLTTDKDGALGRAIGLAVAKLRESSLSDVRPLILLLLDADDDPACELGPRLLEETRQARPDQDIACVIANVEYETWFVAAASSLEEYLDLPEGQTLPEYPEKHRQSKGWIKRHFKGKKYRETVDQPKLTAKMDLALCRIRSPSFDKLCRELEKRMDEVS